MNIWINSQWWLLHEGESRWHSSLHVAELSRKLNQSGTGQLSVVWANGPIGSRQPKKHTHTTSTFWQMSGTLNGHHVSQSQNLGTEGGSRTDGGRLNDCVITVWDGSASPNSVCQVPLAPQINPAFHDTRFPCLGSSLQRKSVAFIVLINPASTLRWPHVVPM